MDWNSRPRLLVWMGACSGPRSILARALEVFSERAAAAIVICTVFDKARYDKA